MGKCLRCGKSGLLFHVNKNGLCPNCAKEIVFRNDIEAEMYRADEKYRQLVHQNADADRLINLLNQAQEQYKKDNNLERLIEAYEAVLIKVTKPVHSPSVAMRLVDLYLKAGQNDKAWGYLNSLLSRTDYVVPRDKIRFAQVKILKKEDKLAEAVEMLILGYYAKSRDQEIDRATFEKELKPMAKKLGWNEEMISKTSSLLQTFATDKKGDEASIIKTYRKLIQV